MECKRKRMFLTVFNIIAVTITMLILLLIIGKLYYTEKRILERDWDINLPNKMKVEYKTKSIGWFGEGIKYIVFKLDTEPVIFLKDFSYGKNTNIKILIETGLLEEDIPNVYIPNWSNNYYWKCLITSSELYMIYFPETFELIICEIRN